jgi:hypothetical protein
VTVPPAAKGASTNNRGRRKSCSGMLDIPIAAAF